MVAFCNVTLYSCEVTYETTTLGFEFKLIPKTVITRSVRCCVKSPSFALKVKPIFHLHQYIYLSVYINRLLLYVMYYYLLCEILRLGKFLVCFWQKCGRHSKGRCTSTTCRQVAVLGMTLASRETARQSWVQRCWDRCLQAGRWGTLPAAVATMLTTTTEQHSLLILVSPQQSSPTLLSQ